MLKQIHPHRHMLKGGKWFRQPNRRHTFELSRRYQNGHPHFDHSVPRCSKSPVQSKNPKARPRPPAPLLSAIRLKSKGCTIPRPTPLTARKMIIHLKIDLKWMDAARFFHVPSLSSMNVTGLGVDTYLMNERRPSASRYPGSIKSTRTSYQSFPDIILWIVWWLSHHFNSFQQFHHIMSLASSWVIRRSRPNRKPRYCIPNKSAAVVANDPPKTPQAMRKWIRRYHVQSRGRPSHQESTGNASQSRHRRLVKPCCLHSRGSSPKTMSPSAKRKSSK